MITLIKSEYLHSSYELYFGCDRDRYFSCRKTHDNVCLCGGVIEDNFIMGRVYDDMAVAKFKGCMVHIELTYHNRFDKPPTKEMMEKMGIVLTELWEIFETWIENGVDIRIYEYYTPDIEKAGFKGLEDWRPVKSKTKSAAKAAKIANTIDSLHT